jgi:dTDP-4-amino-4,6-dideoxygalactose transaminase
MAPFSRSNTSLPNTDFLCGRLIQLPTAQTVSLDDIARIGRCVRAIWMARQRLQDWTGTIR